VAALLGLGAILFLVTRADQLGGDNPVEITGDATLFRIGDSAEISQTIAESGPLLFPDTTGAGRDVYLQHVGDDPQEGWAALVARPPGNTTDCPAQWEANQQAFVDVCNGTEYPADGEGLTSYPVRIDADGAVVVDLNPLNATPGSP
jgi:hypothetical protein